MMIYPEPMFDVHFASSPWFPSSTLPPFDKPTLVLVLCTPLEAKLEQFEIHGGGSNLHTCSRDGAL